MHVFFNSGMPTIYFWLTLFLLAIALDNIFSLRRKRKETKEKLAEIYYQKLNQEKAKETETQRKKEEIKAEAKKKKEEAKLKAAEIKRKKVEAKAETKRKKEEAKLRAAEIKRKKELAISKAAELKRKKEEIKARLSEEKEKKEEAKRKKNEAEEIPDETKIKIEKIANFEVIDIEQLSEKVSSLRHLGIGVSDAPTVMEVDDLRSPETLMDFKRNKVAIKPTQKMLKDIAIEPEARLAYIEETGIDVEPLWIQHKEFPWLFARLCGISDDYNHIVEIKCGATAYIQARNNKITDYCNVQLQHMMMVTGLDKIDYWCFWQGRKGILQIVERDEEFIDKLFQAELEFINNLNKEEDQ